MGLLGELAWLLADKATLGASSVVRAEMDVYKTHAEIDDGKEIEFDKLLDKWDEILSRIIANSNQNSMTVKYSDGYWVKLPDDTLFLIKRYDYGSSCEGISIDFCSEEKKLRFALNFSLIFDYDESRDKDTYKRILEMSLELDGEIRMFARARADHKGGNEIDDGFKDLLQRLNKNTEIVSKISRCERIYDCCKRIYEESRNAFRNRLKVLANATELLEEEQKELESYLPCILEFKDKEVFDKLMSKWDELFQRENWIKNPKFDKNSPNVCKTKDFDIEVSDDGDINYYYDKSNKDNYLYLHLNNGISVGQNYNSSTISGGVDCHVGSIDNDELFALVNRKTRNNYKKFLDNFIQIKEKAEAERIKKETERAEQEAKRAAQEAERAEQEAKRAEQKAKDDALAALDNI